MRHRLHDTEEEELELDPMRAGCLRKLQVSTHVVTLFSPEQGGKLSMFIEIPRERACPQVLVPSIPARDSATAG